MKSTSNWLESEENQISASTAEHLPNNDVSFRELVASQAPYEIDCLLMLRDMYLRANTEFSKSSPNSLTYQGRASQFTQYISLQEIARHDVHPRPGLVRIDQGLATAPSRCSIGPTAQNLPQSCRGRTSGYSGSLDRSDWEIVSIRTPEVAIAWYIVTPRNSVVIEFIEPT